MLILGLAGPIAERTNKMQTPDTTGRDMVYELYEHFTYTWQKSSSKRKNHLCSFHLLDMNGRTVELVDVYKSGILGPRFEE